MSNHSSLLNSKLSRLALGIAMASTSTVAFSAGLDRTGQDIRGFFNEGTYAEVDFVYIDTDISGHDNGANPLAITAKESEYVEGKSTGNITGEGSFIHRYGVKADLNDNLVVGVFYDQPWGANVRFEGDSSFVSNDKQSNIITSDNPNTDKKNDVLYFPGTTVNYHINKNDPRYDPKYDLQTSADLKSDTLTGLIGVKKDGFMVYGGPVMQRMQADVSLRGNAYGPLSGYDVSTQKDTDYGWVAGAAYSIPEIKLNAAVTYRSPIEHKALVTESLPIMSKGSLVGGIVADQLKLDKALMQETLTTEGTVTTPESVNLNLQSGLSQKHQLLGTLNARWVPWSKFKIVPPYYNVFSKASFPEGLPLLAYDKDQYSVDVGLAKRFTPNLAASAIVGWDSGAGNPVGSIGPVDGAWSVGGGVKYNVTDEFAITAGGKYLWFGDATAVLPNGSTVGKYEDNTGYAGVVKLSYNEVDGQ